MKKYLTLMLCILLVLCIGITTMVKANDNGKLMKQDVSIMSNDHIEVEYKKEISTKYENLSVYEDSNNNQYYFDENNNLVGYYRKANTSKPYAMKASLKEAKTNEFKKKSAEIGKQLIMNNNAKKINNTKSDYLDKYELINYGYVESYNEYVYTYSKIIDGYNTNDSFTISLDQNGELMSFVSNRQSMLDNYDKIKIDKDDVKKFIENEMSNFEFVELAKPTYTIDFIDHKLTLQIFIGYKNNLGIWSSTILNYEL